MIWLVSRKPGRADVGRRDHVDRDRSFEHRALGRAGSDDDGRVEIEDHRREREVAGHGLARVDRHRVGSRREADSGGAHRIGARRRLQPIRAVLARDGALERRAKADLHACQRLVVRRIGDSTGERSSLPLGRGRDREQREHAKHVRDQGAPWRRRASQANRRLPCHWIRHQTTPPKVMRTDSYT